MEMPALQEFSSTYPIVSPMEIISAFFVRENSQQQMEHALPE